MVRAKGTDTSTGMTRMGFYLPDWQCLSAIVTAYRSGNRSRNVEIGTIFLKAGVWLKMV
jgi:hypothetical protein